MPWNSVLSASSSIIFGALGTETGAKVAGGAGDGAREGIWSTSELCNDGEMAAGTACRWPGTNEFSADMQRVWIDSYLVNMNRPPRSPQASLRDVTTQTFANCQDSGGA